MKRRWFVADWCIEALLTVGSSSSRPLINWRQTWSTRLLSVTWWRASSTPGLSTVQSSVNWQCRHSGHSGHSNPKYYIATYVSKINWFNGNLIWYLLSSGHSWSFLGQLGMSTESGGLWWICPGQRVKMTSSSQWRSSAVWGPESPATLRPPASVPPSAGNLIFSSVTQLRPARHFSGKNMLSRKCWQ